MRTDPFFVGAAYRAAPLRALDGEGYRIVDARHHPRATLAMPRATCSLSKRTAVYARTAHLWNGAHARYSVSGGGGTKHAPGIGRLGAMAGIRQLFRARAIRLSSEFFAWSRR